MLLINVYFSFRGLLNGCDGNHVRICHHDGHRAQLLLSRTYPHACARLGSNVSELKGPFSSKIILVFSVNFRHILGKKTPRVPGPKFQKEKKNKASHSCLANNQSFRCNNKSGSGSHNAGRRASTSVQFGGNTNMEGSWTSISQRWPTWQLFRSVLLSIAAKVCCPSNNQSFSGGMHDAKCRRRRMVSYHGRPIMVVRYLLYLP